MAASLLREKAAAGRTEQDCQLVKVATVMCVCESPDEEDVGGPAFCSNTVIAVINF